MLASPDSVRWPYCFSLDDLEITGAILEPETIERDQVGWIVAAHTSGPQRAGDRVPGVWVTHKPTGAQCISTSQATREENLQLALQRLDLQLRRREP